MSKNQRLPLVGFYIQRIAEINHAELSDNYLDLFKLLLTVSDTFHKDDRELCKEAREQLDQYVKQIRRVNGRTYNHTIQLRSKKGAEIFNNGGREAKLLIFNTMWDKGYITKADFKPPTRKDNFFE